MDEQRAIHKITTQVVHQYPEFANSKPTVKWTDPGAGSEMICTLVFKTIVRLANGKSLNRRLKVVGTAEGKIQKMTSSK